MNALSDDHELENRLQSALGVAPEPDFNQWCKKHPEEVAALSNSRLADGKATRPRTANRWLNRRTFWKIAASVLLLAGAAWLLSGSGNLGPNAFAQGIPGVDNVQGMTWTQIFFERMTSEDKKRTWIQQTRTENAYQHPGKYCRTHFDQQGNPDVIFITDLQANRQLTLKPKEKKAVLQVPSRGEEDIRGPFAWVGDEIRMTKVNGGTAVVSVSLAGQQKLGDRNVNIVRVKSRMGWQSHTVDYLFDEESKQLVSFASGNPGSGFHPDTSTEELKKPAEKRWSNKEAIGHRTHEIVVDANIKASLFSLDAPEGYEVDKIAEPTVTEDDFVAFLTVAARFNDSTFPDSAFVPYDRDKFNAESKKSNESRTDVAKALFAIRDKIAARGIYQTPALRFVEDQTKKDSFHYVGADVRIGEAKKIVFWYKPNRGKAFRALFGDLTVRDVTSKELPLVLTP